MSPTAQTILVTGGTGYIGSHTVVQLLEAGNKVVILHDLCNSKREVLNRIEQSTGKRPDLVIGDISDCATLRSLFANQAIDAVIHFAGLKLWANPLLNRSSIATTTSRAPSCSSKKWRAAASRQWSSRRPPRFTATPLAYRSVKAFRWALYGQSKLMVEAILADLYQADPSWAIALLRYFNPVGARESGLIGEDPSGIPNNLMPLVAQVAVFGNDYPTPDGTGMRDCIHVDDLVAGHLAALKALNQSPEMRTVNLGTGRPYSVREMTNAFVNTTGNRCPTRSRPVVRAICPSATPIRV